MIPEKGHKANERNEHISYEGRLRAGFIQPGRETRLLGDLKVAFQSLNGRDNNFLHGQIGIGQGELVLN